MSILWALVILLFPALILYLCHRYPIIDRVGAVVLCYLGGLVIGNSGLLPTGFAPVQQGLLTYTVPIALPLLFFSLDIKRWIKLAGISLLSFGLMAVAVLVGATVAFLIFRGMAGGETWKVAGMLIGCYTGGSPNLAAIGTALNTTPTVYVAVNIADMIIPPLYLLAAMTVLQRLLLTFLPPYRDPIAAEGKSPEEEIDFTDYSGIFSPGRLGPLGAAFILSLVIFAAGGGLSMLVPREYSATVAILCISTLGILASFVPRVRRIKMTFHLGQYIILVFSVVISTYADLTKLLGTAGIYMAFVAVTIIVAASLHYLFAYFFKIDADTVIITSIAGIFSPPFVPMVAAALKNRMMVITGVITGIIGWVIGTYLGISYAYLIRYLFTQ